MSRVRNFGRDLYNWKTKYGGMEILDIPKLKELTDENRRLKQMYVDLSLKHEALKDIVEKSSEACGEARTGRLRAAGTWDQPASCV